MTKHFNIGDILKGTRRGKNEAFHPIIYLGEASQNQIDFFIGGMITHSKKFRNIKFKDIHYKVKIDNDSRSSYFVNNYLYKKQEWGPFRIIGKLSKEGIGFVLDNIKGSKPEIWEKYLS